MLFRSVGGYQEDSCASGVNGNASNNGCSNAGAAYVFTRSGTAWSQQAYLKAGNTDAGDYFGISVSIDGDSLVVGAYGEASCATGVDGDGSNNGCTQAGAAYVFTRSAATWSQQAYLKAGNAGLGDQFGSRTAIGGDTVLVGAWLERSCTIVDPADNDCGMAGAAYVFSRSGTTWSQDAYLKSGNAGAGDAFGDSVALSGGLAVIGADYEQSCATGIDGNGSDDGCSGAGAAYVFAADRSGPTIGSIRSKPGRPAAGTKVKVTAVASDPSGVASAEVRVGKGKAVAMRGVGGFGQLTQPLAGSILVPRAGRQSICIRATDSAGNRSPWRCTKVTVSAFEPLPSPTPSPLPSPEPPSSPAPSPGPEASPVPSPQP